MKTNLKVLLGIAMVSSSAVQAADLPLPSRKAAPCNCRLHIERPDVFVNGQVPRGAYVVSSKATEGTFVSSTEPQIKTTSIPSESGWLAHYNEGQPGLYAGDRVSLVNGGQAHLSWKDGTVYELTQPVTEIGPEICQATTAPVVAMINPGVVAGAASLAAVAAGVTVGVTNNGNPNDPGCTVNCNPASP